MTNGFDALLFAAMKRFPDDEIAASPCQHVYCQRPIVGRRDVALYCSKSCKRKAKDYRAVRRRGLRPLGRKNKRISQCEVCDTPFIAWAAGNPRLTCSKACARKRERRLHPTTPRPPRSTLSPAERHEQKKATERARYHAQSPEQKHRNAERRRMRMTDPKVRAHKVAWSKKYRRRLRDEAWRYRLLVQGDHGPISHTLMDDVRRFRLLMTEDRTWQLQPNS
jgi:hypothetical protein